MSLENAPDDVKLAVDLIVLLEENQIPASTVLRALDIVKRDYEKKLTRDDEAMRLRKALRLSGLHRSCNIKGGITPHPVALYCPYPTAGVGSSPL